MFKLDCVDLVWYLAAKERPEYLSNESDLEFDPGAVVTSYRILVTAAVVFLGCIKSTFTYSGSLVAPIWVEWLLSGFGLSLCVNFNLAQVNQMLNYENPPLVSTSLVYMKITHWDYGPHFFGKIVPTPWGWVCL
jgi:hypothetical protein